MPATKIKFDWIEYSVFSMMLTISALVGVYFGFIKKTGQDTVDGYLLGDKKMTIFPISMSLISSLMSGIALLGVPAEVYTHGINFGFTLVSYTTSGLLCAFIFLPVFFKLQLISVYEYMELRFSKFVRKMVSFLFTVSLLIYTPIVIYGPALALNQVSDLSIYTVAFILSSVCIFYTALGGLKAVVWTDTIQGVVMYGAVFTVAIIGTIKCGGIGTVLSSGYEGGRLDIAWDIDPRVRLSFWSGTIGLIVTDTASSAVHPSFVQRFISLKTMREARWSVLFFIFGSCVFVVVNLYMGLVLYSYYKGCDPLTTGVIDKSDQILSYFVMDVIGNVRGLPGVFLAGIVCAALSTMSAGLNTLAGTMYEDFIEPITGRTSGARAAKIMKCLVVGFGFLSLLLVVVIERLGSLVELYNCFAGPSAGVVLGIFLLGLFFPHANSKGATAGGLFSLAVMCWIILGSRAAIADGDIVYPSLPISVDHCPNDFKLAPNSTLIPPAVSGRVFPLFEITIFYYTALACFITVVFGNIVSYFTGFNDLERMDRDLLSPLIHGYLPKYTAVPLKDVKLK